MIMKKIHIVLMGKNINYLYVEIKMEILMMKKKLIIINVIKYLILMVI